MAVIKTKIPRFTGIRANVQFTNGVGYTDNQHLIDWFSSHGYIVENEQITEKVTEKVTEKPKSLEDMSVDELKEYLRSMGKGTYIGNTKDKDKLISRIKSLEKLEKE